MAPDSPAPMIRVHGDVCIRGAGLLYPEHLQHRSVPDDCTLVLRHEALIVDARRDRLGGGSVLVDRAARKLRIQMIGERNDLGIVVRSAWSNDDIQSSSTCSFDCTIMADLLPTESSSILLAGACILPGSLVSRG